MDITFIDSEAIENNQHILTHVFFNLVDYDFRNGIFSNESSIHDMGTSGFTESDYIALANEYYEKCPPEYNYSQGMKFYQHLSNECFDNMIGEKFQNTYGFVLDKKIHLLKDIAILLKNHFPERNWEQDTIFILKTLDHRLAKEEQEILAQFNNKDKKVVKLPVKKKLSPEEVRNGFNEYRMVEQLGMQWKEARELAQSNFEKSKEGKKFEPYVPEMKSHKPKM